MTPKNEEPAIVKCHLCDNPSDHVRQETREGHTVKDGKVVKCPYIDMNFSGAQLGGMR